MKTKAIIILGDSFSNGDGVAWPSAAESIQGVEWRKDIDSLLHKQALLQVTNQTPNETLNTQIQERFTTQWIPQIRKYAWSDPEYTRSRGNWSSTFESASGYTVINLAIAGGSTQGMMGNLLHWVSHNKHFIQKHDICVMANFSMNNRISVTSRYEDHNYEPREQTNRFGGNTVTYSANNGPQSIGDNIIDPWMAHLDLMDHHEWDFCSNLKLIHTICELAGMNVAWCGPVDPLSIKMDPNGELTRLEDVKTANYLGLDLPMDRYIGKLDAHFTDICHWTLWVCRDEIVNNNFNPYSLCGHFNAFAQHHMGNRLNDLVKSNEDWFFPIN